MNINNTRVIPILLIFAILLSACGSASTPTSVPEPQVEEGDAAQVETPTEVAAEPEAVAQEDVTISFWHTYNEVSPENEMLTGTLIPLFEEAHPEINVESLSVPWDEFREKLFTSIAGGVAPDMIRSDIIWVPELADMGALVALDEAMSDFEAYKELVFPGPLSTNYWDGHYYGLPLDTNTKVLLHNKEMYAAAGIESAPQTLDELVGQCEAVKASNPDAYVFAADGTFAWVMLPWIWSMGGEITNPEITQASGYLNSPATVSVYETWLQLFKDGCIAPSMLGDGIDPYTGFAQDLYANIDNGPWSFPIYEGQFPDKELVPSLFPAGDGGSIEVVGGEDIVLFKQSEHQEAALEFIRFVLSTEYQLKMAEVGQIPVLLDALESDYMQSHPYYGIFLEQLTTAQARPSHPKWSLMDEIITDAGQLILREEMTPQEALDDAAAQIDALLAN